MKDKTVVIDITEDYKLYLSDVCAEVIELLASRTRSPADAYIALQLAMEILSQKFQIEDVQVLPYQTEMKQ